MDNFIDDSVRAEFPQVRARHKQGKPRHLLNTIINKIAHTLVYYPHCCPHYHCALFFNKEKTNNNQEDKLYCKRAGRKGKSTIDCKYYTNTNKLFSPSTPAFYLPCLNENKPAFGFCLSLSFSCAG